MGSERLKELAIVGSKRSLTTEEALEFISIFALVKGRPPGPPSAPANEVVGVDLGIWIDFLLYNIDKCDAARRALLRGELP